MNLGEKDAPRQRRTQSGAAAVEFALVSVVLFPLIFGMIQYGLLFNDYLQVRQGVREAARTGVVQTPVTTTACVTAAGFLQSVACDTVQQAAPTTGDVAVRVVLPTGTWKRGDALLVCAVSKSNGPGIVPMPNNSYVRATARMAIEQVTTTVTGSSAVWPSTFTTDPSGGSWSWCT